MTSIGRRIWLTLAVTAGVAATAHAQATLQIGSYPSNPPFEFKTDSGQFQGFEVDLVKAVADKLGMSPAFTDLGFQALFAATASHRVDHHPRPPQEPGFHPALPR